LRDRPGAAGGGAREGPRAPGCAVREGREGPPLTGCAANVRKIYAIRFLFWFHTVSAVLVPFFRDWGGLSLGGVFLLNAWFQAWSFALEVPTGTVADRLGRKTSVCLGTAAGALAVPLYVATPEVGAFLVAEVLMALAMALNSGADEALLYESLPERDPLVARRVFARAESWKLAGIVAGALVGSALATRTSVRGVFAFQALPMALSAVLALSLREPPARAAPGAARPGFLQLAREGARQLAARRTLRILAFDMISVGALVWLVIWLYQPLLEAAGVPLAAFGSVHVAAALGQIAILASADRAQSWLGSQRALLFATALVPGAAFVALGVVRAPVAVAGLVVVAWSLGMARTPLFTAALNRHIDSEQRATVLSLVSGLRRLGIVVANATASLFVASALHGTALAIGVAVLALALVSRVREEHLA